MVHDGHLLTQCFQILLRYSQTGRKDVTCYGHHLLQDVLLATELLHRIEKLPTPNTHVS